MFMLLDEMTLDFRERPVRPVKFHMHYADKSVGLQHFIFEFRRYLAHCHNCIKNQVQSACANTCERTECCKELTEIQVQDCNTIICNTFNPS